MRKNKKQKNNLKRNLLLFGFLLIIVSLIDTKNDKKDFSLLASNEKAIYTNVNAKEVINILNEDTGVLLIVDDKRDINKITNILDNLKTDENIYVYNSSKDEMILDLKEGELYKVQDSSDDYNILLKKLGNYTEEYLINGIDTGYRRINTPMVIFIKNGTIEYSYYISNIVGEETLTNIYSAGFARIEN